MVASLRCPCLLASALAFCHAFQSPSITVSRVARANSLPTGARAVPSPQMKGELKWLEYSYGLQDPEIKLPVEATENSGPEPFPINEEQIATLYRDGAVHIPQVLSGPWLAYLRACTDHQVENQHFFSSPGVASGLYDYIQRNVWTTNKGFLDFLYYSPVMNVLAQLGRAEEVRLTTDLLMCGPNKGFKWHQDNQNGPVEFDDALRFWVTMDDTPADHGAPVYLKGSHNNTSVDDGAVFVNIDEGDLPNYPELLEFRPKAGDMIVWMCKSIHKIDGPKSQDWGSRQRRVLGGTVALDNALYTDKQKVEFADLGNHGKVHGDPLGCADFPLLYPRADATERELRMQGIPGRSGVGMARLAQRMFSMATASQFLSFGKVYNKEKAPTPEGGDEQLEGGTAATESR